VGILELSYDAGWSSPVARRAHNPKVTGSNPVPATKESPGQDHSPTRAFVVLRASSTGFVINLSSPRRLGSEAAGFFVINVGIGQPSTRSPSNSRLCPASPSPNWTAQMRTLQATAGPAVADADAAG
jgi:hypothetical protein